MLALVSFCLCMKQTLHNTSLFSLFHLKRRLSDIELAVVSTLPKRGTRHLRYTVPTKQNFTSPSQLNFHILGIQNYIRSQVLDKLLIWPF